MTIKGDALTDKIMETAKRELIERRGPWWTRKAIHIAGFKAAIQPIAISNKMMAELMTKMMAHDLIDDFREHYPDVNSVALTAMMEEFTTDADMLLNTVVKEGERLGVFPKVPR